MDLYPAMTGLRLMSQWKHGKLIIQNSSRRVIQYVDQP